MSELEHNARKNVKEWENFVETEEYLKIYAPRSAEDVQKRWGSEIQRDLIEEEDCTTTPVKL
jgi:hypothetical protein